MFTLSVTTAKMGSTISQTIKIVYHATVIQKAVLTIFARRRLVSVIVKWGLEALGDVMFVNLEQGNTQIVEVN